MREKTLTHVLLVILAVSTLLCGTAFALMFRQTNHIENRFQPARVDCVVHEELDGSGNFTNGSQYAEKKTGIQVKNTGNIDAYIRVRFVSYWVDINGNIVGQASKMPAISITGDWLAGSNNTYYYKYPVAPEDYTKELLNGVIALGMEEGYVQVLEVFADAIQSKPSKAASDSWKVTIDANGNITGVS